MNSDVGVIVIDRERPGDDSRVPIDTIVRRAADRVWDAVHIVSAKMDGGDSGLAARIGELVHRDARDIAVILVSPRPDEQLLRQIRETLAECRAQHPGVTMTIRQPSAPELVVEDSLVERIWPLFADNRDQPATGPEIERRSHAIIDKRLARSVWTDDASRAIVRRVVHATADVSFAASMRIHPEAIARGTRALQEGRPVICDVGMVRRGITRYTGETLCAIQEATVAESARANGTTRAAAAMEFLRERLDGAVVAVGNAPTALWKLMAMAKEQGAPSPALVIGLPVGFVGALESKMALTRSDLCYITNVSPRGGSPAAAAAMNALSILAETTA